MSATKPQQPQTEEVELVLPGGEVVTAVVPVGLSDDEVKRRFRNSPEFRGAEQANAVRMPKPVQQDPAVGPTGRILDTAETGLREFGLGVASTTMPGGENISLPTGRELRNLASSPLASVKEVGAMGIEGLGALLSLVTGSGAPTPEMARAGSVTGDVRTPQDKLPPVKPLEFEDVAFGAGAGAGLAADLTLGSKGGRSFVRAAVDDVASAGRALVQRAPRTIGQVGRAGTVSEDLFQALKPSKATRLRLAEDLPGAIQDIVDDVATQNAAGLPAKLESVADVGAAASRARRRILDDINKLTQEQGISGDGDNIAAALRSFQERRKVRAFKKAGGEAVQELPPGTRDPGDLIDEYIQFYEGKNIPIDELENLRRGLNAQKDTFMRKNQIRQGKELQANPVTGTQVELIAALEKEIESALSKIKSPGAKELRKRYAKLRSVEDAVLDRYITELVDNSPGLLEFDSLDTIAAGSAASALLTGNGEIAGSIGLTVAARRAINVIGGKFGNPDRLVRKALEGLEGGEFRRVVPPERPLLTGRTDVEGPFPMGAAPPDSPAFGSQLTVRPAAPGEGGLQTGSRLLPERTGSPFAQPDVPERSPLATRPTPASQGGRPLTIEPNRQLPPARFLTTPPNIQFVDALPSVGETIGQALVNKSTSTMNVWNGNRWVEFARWDGTRWVPIAP